MLDIVGKQVIYGEKWGMRAKVEGIVGNALMVNILQTNFSDYSVGDIAFVSLDKAIKVLSDERVKLIEDLEQAARVKEQKRLDKIKEQKEKLQKLFDENRDNLNLAYKYATETYITDMCEENGLTKNKIPGVINVLNACCRQNIISYFSSHKVINLLLCFRKANIEDMCRFRGIGNITIKRTEELKNKFYETFGIDEKLFFLFYDSQNESKTINYNVENLVNFDDFNDF